MPDRKTDNKNMRQKPLLVPAHLHHNNTRRLRYFKLGKEVALTARVRGSYLSMKVTVGFYQGMKWAGPI
jgi:hypothetical protein